jgi:hypothetical protein
LQNRCARQSEFEQSGKARLLKKYIGKSSWLGTNVNVVVQIGGEVCRQIIGHAIRLFQRFKEIS